MPPLSLPPCWLPSVPRRSLAERFGHLEPAGPRGAPGTAWERAVSGFPALPHREGHREVLRGERASAGLGREGKARSPLLFQKSALNVTPRRKGSRRNTPLPAPRRPPPRPFPWKLVKGGGVDFATEKSHLGLKQFGAFVPGRSCPSRGGEEAGRESSSYL